jgi:hypothetical protein
MSDEEKAVLLAWMIFMQSQLVFLKQKSQDPPQEIEHFTKVSESLMRLLNTVWTQMDQAKQAAVTKMAKSLLLQESELAQHG